MRFTSETTSNGVTERLFTLDDITGVIWSPANATGSHPLVLLGHGGGQHKKAAGVLARARQYAACGFAAAAIDAPGHGDRPPVERHQRLMADIRQRVADGEALGPHMAGYNVVLAAQAVPEWQATLDALLELDGITGPGGYWGISMGGGIGVLLVAAEPRIGAGVLGLAGHETLLEAAGRISVPVEFVSSGSTQWFRATTASRCSTPSPHRRRRCTPTRAVMETTPGSRWTARCASSPVTCSLVILGNSRLGLVGSARGRLAGCRHPGRPGPGHMARM